MPVCSQCFTPKSVIAVHIPLLMYVFYFPTTRTFCCSVHRQQPRDLPELSSYAAPPVDTKRGQGNENLSALLGRRAGVA